MKIIAITGGIGSGKSVVCKTLKASGFAVYDSDERAKYITKTSADVKYKLQSLLGEEIYENNNLNKKMLADFLFASAQNTKIINSIIHPAVKDDFKEWCLQQNSEFVFIESAILFESGFDNLVDEIWCVTASEDVRIARVMARNGMSAEEVRSRIKSQMSDNERKSRSDYIIDNDGKSSVLKQLEKILGYI